MLNKYFFLFLQTIILVGNTSQKNVLDEYDFTGTIVMVGCASDGIFMISDSRAASLVDMKKVAFYMDSCPKIIRIKDYVIGFSGVENLGNKLISQIIKDFVTIQFQK